MANVPSEVRASGLEAPQLEQYLVFIGMEVPQFLQVVNTTSCREEMPTVQPLMIERRFCTVLRKRNDPQVCFVSIALNFTLLVED